MMEREGLNSRNHTDSSRGTVGTAEDDGALELASGHVTTLGGAVDDVVDGLHGEVEGHELDDGDDPRHGRADADACEPGFRDGRVHYSVPPVFLHQSLAHLHYEMDVRKCPCWWMVVREGGRIVGYCRYLVGAVVLADLLAQQDNLGIPRHFLVESFIQCISNRNLTQKYSLGQYIVAERV